MNSDTNTYFSKLRGGFAIALLAVVALFAFSGIAAAHPNDACTLEISPKTADNPLGAVHTVTATVTRKGNKIPCGAGAGPLANVAVVFTAISGPSVGATATVLTDLNGEAKFSWVSNTVGTDVVQAAVTQTYCDDAGVTPCPAGKTHTEVISSKAVKNWICVTNCNPPCTVNCGPPPCTVNCGPVIKVVDPAVAIKIAKQCVKRKFTLKPSIAGSVTSATLYIDGKKIKVVKGQGAASAKFTVDTGRYSSGSHKVLLVTTFTNGVKINRVGKFKLCKARTTARRTDPNFTG
ncbi:MAG: hypothetical protein JHC87_03930 [Thermoleophilaceae bacterium]|nr:hypothetical protein [Thermoleophilaceae bacterium]